VVLGLQDRFADFKELFDNHPKYVDSLFNAFLLGRHQQVLPLPNNVNAAFPNEYWIPKLYGLMDEIKCSKGAGIEPAGLYAGPNIGLPRSPLASVNERFGWAQ
jgi:hypothetical protein